MPLEETLLIGPLQAVSQETHLTSAPVTHIDQTNAAVTPEEKFVSASQAEVIEGNTLRSKFAKWLASFK